MVQRWVARWVKQDYSLSNIVIDLQLVMHRYAILLTIQLTDI